MAGFGAPLFRFPLRSGVVAHAGKKNPKRHSYDESAPAGPLLYVTAAADGSDAWRLDEVARRIEAGAVGIIPTDTLYAFVCDVDSASAVER